MIGHVKKRVRDFLVRTQGFTGTDNVYIAKGSFWAAAQFAAQTALSIGTVIAFANLLPRETYGVYKYLISLAGSFGFLTLTGMNTAIVRAVARGQSSVVPYSVRLQLRWNAIFMVAIGALAVYYGIRGNSIFAVSLACLAISLPLVAAYNTYVAVLTGRKEFERLAKMTALSALIAATAIIGGLLVTSNVAVLIAIYAVATAVPNIVFYYVVMAGTPRQTPPLEAIAELRSTGFHLSAIGVIGTLAQYLDKIILFQAVGPAALAVYGFAIAGPDRLKGLTKNIVAIALPRLATRSIEQIRSVFYRRMGMTLLVGLGIAGMYTLIAPQLFRWFLPQYLDAIRYSQVYVLGPAVGLAAYYVSTIFQGQNMLRATYISSIGGQGSRIILFVLLGWTHGIWGIVVATVAASVLALILHVAVWEIESRKLLHAQPAQL